MTEIVDAAQLEKQKNLISFLEKKGTKCPLCGTEFHYEHLHTGRGRLISEEITPELRRVYKENKKFGSIHPLAYTLMVCHNCLYSSYSSDFMDLDEVEKQSLIKQSQNRRSKIEKILGVINFTNRRNLALGAASYLLALDCYHYRSVRIAPTPKKALISLRAAWLFGDIEKKFPNFGFQNLSELLFVKSASFYIPTIEILSTGSEPQAQFLNLLGPDVDKNWGFEGVVYINSYLSFKYAEKLTSEKEKIVTIYENARRNLARLYGHGRSSSAKPSLIIQFSRDLREKISSKLKELGALTDEDGDTTT